MSSKEDVGIYVHDNTWMIHMQEQDESMQVCRGMHPYLKSRTQQKKPCQLDSAEPQFFHPLLDLRACAAMQCLGIRLPGVYSYCLNKQKWPT